MWISLVIYREQKTLKLNGACMVNEAPKYQVLGGIYGRYEKNNYQKIKSRQNRRH